MAEKIHISGSLTWRVIAALLRRARSCGIKTPLWFVLISALVCIFIYNLTTDPSVSRVQTTRSSKINSVYYRKHYKSIRNITITKSVLVIYDSTCRNVFQKIKTLLQAQKIDYETYFFVPGKQPPGFLNSHNKKVPHSLIIFASLNIYQTLPSFHKDKYNNFCRNTKVGIIFVAFDLSGSIEVANGAALSLYNFNAEVKNFYVYPTKFLHITKGDINVLPAETDWTFFNVDSGSFAPIASVEYLNHDTQKSVTYPVILADDGNNDGVRRIYFGNSLNSWIVKLLLLDAIQHFSARPLLRFGLKRYILVDIDDIFVAPPGTRMKVDDVKALVDTQEVFRSKVPGFTFNLGYAGYFYNQGLEEEVEGGNVSCVYVRMYVCMCSLQG